ncbi:MAG: deoxyribodipyrimidine photo-lyase [Proteobacteria bacterium]|nr:deoxyribodipyrimidine photo-lyase [Pseudomonadota bacterium]
MSNNWGIHWFRRDLRVTGNAALRENFLRHQGRVVGIFTFDHKFLGRPDFSSDRFEFFLNCLRSLRSELHDIGSDLLVLNDGPDIGFEMVLSLCKQLNVSAFKTVSWNRDYEPFARQRDCRLQSYFQSNGVEIIQCRDHLMIEPHELAKPDGTSYHVYTPFAKKWFELIQSPSMQDRIDIQLKVLKSSGEPKNPKLFKLKWIDLFGSSTPKDHCDSMYQENHRRTTISVPAGSASTALGIAKNWPKKIAQYKELRDYPAIEGTSKLSMFLKNGSIVSSQIVAMSQIQKTPFKADSGQTTFLKELAWREFYYHLMWHYPRIEYEAFQVKYIDLPWENNEEWFEAWKIGMTGFPIVDAGMRQLLTTGWMHNRVRMIVASFLTKDLLIDWRWGEKWFMQKLLDGDLAPNNGGWQWAASTGCDAQPYFRIFNPESQSERFDADGAYIKTFVPELKSLSAKEIHNPSKDVRSKLGYPQPIVDHSVQRMAAMALFKK